jgi:segregation and condensation protein A
VSVTAPNATIEQYQLRLPMFEGPLDVLLRLIESRQLAITDVSLVEVTGQFLEYVAGLPAMPPALLADFTAIASRLLVLKSRSLLPAPPVEDDEIETDDLTRQLIAYQAVRETAEELGGRQRRGLRSYPRPLAAEPIRSTVAQLASEHPARLIQALRWSVARKRPEPRSFQPRQIVSLALMTRNILHAVTRTGRQRFSRLLGRRATRPEYVAGFIALLTLWKQRRIVVTQSELFAEIELEAVQPARQAADD